MAVRKIKGSWYVDFSWKCERFRRLSPVDTRSGAQEYELFLRREIAAHGSLDHLDPKRKGPEELTFAEFAADWLRSYVRTNNRASEQRGKESALRRHLLPHFGGLRLRDVQRPHIERYKAAKLEEGISEKTINNHLTMLHRCLRTAQEDGLIPGLPPIKWLKVKPQDFDYLMPFESRRLLSDRTEPMWNEMARLALRTGMRRGELMALDWSAVDLRSARLTVRLSLVEGAFEPPKNNRIRHMPLTEDVVAMLAARARPSGLVFQREDGGPLSTAVMRHGLARLCRRTGLRTIGWHALRHTFASQLAMAGVPILTIKELMGHSTVQMTMRYAHLAPSTLAQAVPALLRAESAAVEDSRLPGVNREPQALVPALQGASF